TTRARDAWLQIDVADHGPGIPELLLLTVFDPFTHAAATPATRRQAPASTTKGPGVAQHRAGQRQGTGLGLGLAIVRAIAEAHHGTATATNPPSGGARLRLHLRIT